MKKRKRISLLALFLVLVVCLGACDDKGQQDNAVVYYCPTFFLLDYSEPTTIKTSELSEPSKEQIEICSQVIETISRKYKMQKAKPNIKCMPDEYFGITDSLIGTAKYDEISKCILIPQSFNESGKSYFAHEYLHYLSDYGGTEIGSKYIIEDEDGSKYLMGSALNESIANYFSIQVFPHPKDTCIYEYETHVAAQLAICVGEENLWTAFTTGNWNKVASFFNDSLKGLYFEESYGNLSFTPFEIMELSLDEYQFLLAYTDEIITDYGFDQWKDNFASDVNSIEEMLINSANHVGKHNEAKKEAEHFLQNCSGKLDFASYTYIERIAG